MLKRLGVLSLFFLSACTGLPEGVTPVTGFDSNRYLGTWHEIARLDHSFERNLERVTATYAANEDGSISVLNKGFNTEQGEWRQAEGVAKPMGAEDVAHLKVSFLARFMEPTRSLNWLKITVTRLSRAITPITYGCYHASPR